MCADTKGCERMVLQKTIQRDEKELYRHPESMEEVCSEDTLSQGKRRPNIGVVEKWLGGKGHDQMAVGSIPDRVLLSSRKHGGSLLRGYPTLR